MFTKLFTGVVLAVTLAACGTFKPAPDCNSDPFLPECQAGKKK